ncbi:hypothetical protein [Alteribacter populi]|uniref:hypothetical protein n=1 Tax=Alteribacter populi TaxID=2011011 RepID=UPI000BBAC32C|nr:hypothetical protein [Alteribacter populi]
MVINDQALQPRPTNELLSEGVRTGAMTFRWYSPLFYLLTLLYFIALHFISFFISIHTTDIAATVVMSFGNILYGFFIFAYITVLLLIPESEGNKERRRLARKPFIRLIFPIFGTGFLFYILFLGGSLLFILPGLIVFVFFLLFPQVLTLEKKSAFSALKRSGVLVKGAFFKVALLYFIFLGTQAFFAIIVALYVSESAFYITGVIAAIAHILIIPFQAAVMSLLYFDLRSDYEAFDLEVLKYEAQQTIEFKKT